MQSTGQTSTHALSFVPMHGSQMIYATVPKYIALLLLLVPPTPVLAQPDAVRWREAPEFVRLFGPAGERSTAYRAFVTALDLDTVLERLGVTLQIRELLPLDAFGQTGGYDRWAITRLYGARRPRVARGLKNTVAGADEFWTLISPHPDATLQQLDRGTLLLVLRMP
jgi:hypothetical protein